MRWLKEIRTLMGNYHVKSGIYHYYRNEFKQAVDFFRKALRDEPRLTDSERRTARYYLTQTFVNSAERLEAKRDLDAAAQDYARAVDVSPGYPDIRFRLGRALEAIDRRDEAIEQYRKAIECCPTYLDAGVALAFCLLEAGRDEEAAGAFEEALRLKIGQTQRPFDEGTRRLRAGETALAKEYFHEAFLSSPHRFEERFRSALAFLKGEEYEKALNDLDGALDLNSNYPDAHNFRGIALCELGRVEEGIASFERAMALNSEFLVPKLNLAFALLRVGKYKEAETELEAVLEMDPSQHAASAKLEELRTGRVAEFRRNSPRGG